MPTAFISHPECLLHDMGTQHPESPQRLKAIDDQLSADGLIGLLMQYDAPLVTREQLQRVHSPDYIDHLERKAPRTGTVYLDADTMMNPHTWQAALRAAGAVVLGVDLVMRRDVENAFCSIRPPGHHAERALAMGFCFFNNVAVGTAHAMTAHGLQRVAIVDFDVHHGNGTENIFHDDARVMLCSTFQHPFYPFRGADSGNEHIINVALPAHSDGEVFRQAVEKTWLPALARFQPEMILVSAGFDAHIEDNMSMLRWRDQDYVWITSEIKKIADRYADGRIISVLEGGYALQALGRCVAAHIRVLAD